NVDAVHVARMREVIQNPESLTQDVFATCGLQSIAYSMLKSDLASFARLTAALVTDKLFDAQGNLQKQVTFTEKVKDKLGNVVKKALAPVGDGQTGKLFSNASKKFTNRGKDALTNPNFFDFAIARSIGRLFRETDSDQYTAE